MKCFRVLAHGSTDDDVRSQILGRVYRPRELLASARVADKATAQAGSDTMGETDQDRHRGPEL